MDSEARELLKVVYFKPLRDALTDMTHGYKSRLAQILGAHELFKTQKDAEGNSTKHKLETDYENLKREIENYFKDGGNGSIITGDINKFLKKHFLLNGDLRNAQIKLTGGELTDILRLLDLIMEGNKSGLGTLNLLCIAAEMLLFNNQKKGLKLAIVEELEAHLHPQYQLRLIDYISSQQNNEQFILSTHSITLASKIRLENLIILKDKEAYPMSADYTMMNPAQYLSGTLLPLFDKNEVTVVANTFFNAVADGNQGGQNLEHGNIYKEDDMEIEIATVHAVKGETHAATLYLETFFNKYYESERLKEQFKGITYMGTDDDTLKSLRVVYVGMSRPRYLLCVAIQKDRFHTIDCQELRDIWDVVEA